jgi:hypothetical protein
MAAICDNVELRHSRRSAAMATAPCLVPIAVGKGKVTIH